MKSIETILRHNSYPGRGILMGRSTDNRFGVVGYFIMGRSENSRNRIFERTEDGIRTRAFDESKLTDPALVIYRPVREIDGHTIVTNGDQTDTIYEYMQRLRTFEEALRSRAFEPDGPIYTPRISGILKPDGSYTLSILKSAEGDPASCRRYFYEYDAPIAGQAHLIHTYQCDGNPPPSFSGEPLTVNCEKDFADYGKRIWNALDLKNKVALFMRRINLETGAEDSLIFNVLEEEAI